ncbi:MAG: glycosyltransferase family 39 protein [Deltaproteobacteria bacterium]|nr:MAG: glycosyltransferase family 39 protein [Deltaproteobacteria bacterium]
MGLHDRRAVLPRQHRSARDHPPLSIAILGGVRALLGDSLFAIRVVPALLGGTTVVLTGLMAREMGGGRAAQGLAGLAALTNLVHLALDSFYSMNAIEIALWAVAMLLVLRIVNGGDRRHWLLLGVILGAGLLNKASMLWFGAGLGVGLALTPERHWLRTPWPWMAGVIAIGCFAPFVWWQWSNGWPFLEFNRNAAAHKIGHVTPIAFASEQILAMNPLAAPLVVGSLAYCWVTESGRRYRAAMWVFVTAFLLLAFSGSARSHYLAPAYPISLAAGSVAVERLARGRRWAIRLTATALSAVAIAAAPLAMPLLSPDATARYQNALGIRPRDEIQRSGGLPMHLALQLHAAAVLEPVAAVYASLPPDERSRVEILTSYFGETGAVNVLGRKLRLPRSIGLHNQYGLWGPGDARGELMIVVHAPEAELDAWFTTCERRASIDCPYCMELLQAEAVYLCRNARRPLRDLWPQMRMYE